MRQFKQIKYSYLAIFVLLAACASTRQFDEYGNPIFHSLNIKDTTFGEWSVDAAYYTIINNINNPNSSVFVSQNPSKDQIWDFALRKPSYFFIVHKNKVVSKMVILLIEKQDKGNIWKYKVIDNNKNESIVNSNITGSLTEHRYIELFIKPDEQRNYKFMQENDGLGVPDHNRIFYRVIPFSQILSDFKKNVIEN